VVPPAEAEAEAAVDFAAGKRCLADTDSSADTPASPAADLRSAAEAAAAAVAASRGAVAVVAADLARTRSPKS